MFLHHSPRMIHVEASNTDQWVVKRKVNNFKNSAKELMPNKLSMKGVSFKYLQLCIIIYFG